MQAVTAVGARDMSMRARLLEGLGGWRPSRSPEALSLAPAGGVGGFPI